MRRSWNPNRLQNWIRFIAASLGQYGISTSSIARFPSIFNNLDSAQSRIYNVTGIEKREDITAIESDIGFNGVKIDKEQIKELSDKFDFIISDREKGVINNEQQ